MNCTYFYIKLFENKEYNGKTREFISTIKLNYPIRGAKFLKIYNLFIKDTILLVKCNLLDQNFIYTNIEDSLDYDDSNIFNKQIVCIGYGDQSDDLIKIDESKSLINEFKISIKNIDDLPFDTVELALALIKIKIYHE